MEAAKKNMVIWLSDPHELGREPRKIEYAGNFGHTFSNMKKYHASTAESDCIKMIEMIRAYWMEQAKRLIEQDG